jgi:hypothetical protein
LPETGSCGSRNPVFPRQAWGLDSGADFAGE